MFYTGCSALFEWYLQNMINDYYTGFYKGLMPDKRLEFRLEAVSCDLINSGTSVINRTTLDHARKTATYRALMNERFDYRDILSAMFRKCSENIDSDHVLCIQDTTEFNYYSISKKIGIDDPDIGPTTNKHIAGLFCHPVLVCDPKGENIYGIGSASVYNRKWGQEDKHERAYRSRPIEEKESYRWLENAQHVKQCINPEVSLTIIGDRESDIYTEFVEVPDERTNILVRSRSDRRIAENDKKLYAYLASQPLAGTYTIELAANSKRSRRIAQMELRFCNATITASNQPKDVQQQKSLYAIEAKEVGPDLASDQTPVLWRLLTTHQVTSYQKAIECVEWYKNRWLIEELFRVIKTKGFRIESSQLSSGAAIKKLVCLTIEAAMHVMRLKLALPQGARAGKAHTVFSQLQVAFLKLLLKKTEGKTVKQKNPYPEYSLAWSAWIIARLGKWTGYKSHGPPGYITIKLGFDTFNTQYEIFELLQNHKNV